MRQSVEQSGRHLRVAKHARPLPERQVRRHNHRSALVEARRLASTFGPDVALVLREASLCLLPVKPSILDVEAARPTVEQLRLLGRPFAFVLNQCNATTQARTLDAATALVSSGALAPSMVATRSDFLDSMTTGQGVTEVAPKGKAAVEVRLLWQWIKAQLAGAKA